MPDKRFRSLKAYLETAMTMVEKLENGEANIDYEDIKSFLEFNVGCALIEVFGLAKKDPCATLAWILKMVQEGKCTK